MDIFEKNEARKNTKISFRTDEDTLSKLKAICRIENRTISSLMENILADYILIHKNPLQGEHEKRLTPRKKCSLPTVVFVNKENQIYLKGTIISLSSNSAQIVLKKQYFEDKLNKKLSILFNLPNNEYPFLIESTLLSYKCLDNECIVVLNFLINNELDKLKIHEFLHKNEYMENV
jgi:predicted lipase